MLAFLSVMGRQPPLVDDSIGPQNLAIITPLFSLGILLFVLRIYTRVTPIYKLNASDYTNAVAVVAQVLTYSFFAAAVGHGFGRHNHFLTPESTVKISKLLFGVIFVGLWASTFARVSMACLLLQFHDLRSIMWKMALWFTIGLQVATLLASEAFQLLECRPLRRMWEEVPDAQCVSPQDAWVVGYLFVAVSVVGDLTLSIMPIFLIWTLNRHVLERLLICVLMGLGFCATAAGVLKVIYMKTSDFTSPDTFRAMMPIFLWCRIEECLIVAASSVPLLKAPIERCLHRLGFPTFQNSVRDMESLHSR